MLSYIFTKTLSTHLIVNTMALQFCY